MSAGEVNPREQRVLVLAPDNADASFVRAVLTAAGLGGDFCADGDALCAAVDEGAGALVVADGALTPAKAACLQETLGRQPPWSDLPLVLLAREASHASTASQASADAEPAGLARGVEAECGGAVSSQSPLLNITLVERPLHARALTCAVRAALRARRRQYEVRDLLADAQRAVRQRDEFLAMLGHELRNPLGVISSAVQILNRIGSPEREASETRDMIERQSSHLTRIVDDLLDVARVSSGRIGLQRETVDVNELARQCFQHCAALIAGRRHEVTFAPAPQPVVVDADPVRLEQIINNLLTNAIKYTPAGGRILLGVTQEPRGTGSGVGAASDDGASEPGSGGGAGLEAVVRVRDSGMGIEPDMLDRVFDMFTQADRSLDRAQGGVGMGLTLVRRLVQLHGGTVSARSAGLGRGSEFEVRLPLLAAAHAQASAPGAAAAALADRPAPESTGSAPAPASGQPTARHVLIVEDGPDARAALGRLLELWGHHVELAEDGTRGVERALASRPEVALIDIGLPGLNGYEVARRVRQVLGNRIRLIALTGYGQPDDQERTREAGFDQHLVKPVNPKLLSRLLAGEAPAPGRSAK